MTKQSGFSLLELMIYITIVGILAGGAYLFFSGRIGAAKESAAKTDLRTFKTAITMYKNDIDRYPGTLEDLIRKPSDPEALKRWRNKYVDPENLKVEDGKIVDPWENPYHYRVTKGGKNPYELWSDGDQEAENPVRIDAWDLKR